MIRYFSKRVIYYSGFKSNPKKFYFSKNLSSFLSTRYSLNYSEVKGAAGYLVDENLCA